jgi:isoquinoline 1-oxidoreductase beta subunit
MAARKSASAHPGSFTIHHIWAAVDAGLALHPKHRGADRNGLTVGLGAALIEEITLSSGVAQQTNFHEYRVIRMSVAPLMGT